jgi:hypothetical protein
MLPQAQCDAIQNELGAAGYEIRAKPIRSLTKSTLAQNDLRFDAKLGGVSMRCAN